MKKRTNEEKLKMLIEACDLLNEASETITKAKKLLHLCGIDMCQGFNEEPYEKKWGVYSNMQIYRGIKKFENITGISKFYEKDDLSGKEDTSRAYIDYRGLRFVQLGDERTSKTCKFTFR